MPNPLLWNPNFVQTRRVAIIVTPGATGGVGIMNDMASPVGGATNTIILNRLPNQSKKSKNAYHNKQ